MHGRGRLLALAGVAVVGVAIAAIVVVVSRGGASARAETPSGDPGAFAISVVRMIVQNRYGDAWGSLHPVDRSVASRTEYVRCENRSPFAARFVRARLGRVGDEPVGLGNGRFVDSKAVEVVVTLRSPGVRRFVVRHTMHVVPAEGKWTWILPAWRYGYFRDDVCPSSTHTASS